MSNAYSKLERGLIGHVIVNNDAEWFVFLPSIDLEDDAQEEG